MEIRREDRARGRGPSRRGRRACAPGARPDCSRSLSEPVDADGILLGDERQRLGAVEPHSHVGVEAIPVHDDVCDVDVMEGDDRDGVGNAATRVYVWSYESGRMPLWSFGIGCQCRVELGTYSAFMNMTPGANGGISAIRRSTGCDRTACSRSARAALRC